jgi:hypothetical protein
MITAGFAYADFRISLFSASNRPTLFLWSRWRMQAGDRGIGVAENNRTWQPVFAAKRKR